MTYFYNSDEILRQILNYIVSAPPLVSGNAGNLLPVIAEGLVYHGRGVRPLDVVVRVPPIVIDRLHRPELQRNLESEFILTLYLWHILLHSLIIVLRFTDLNLDNELLEPLAYELVDLIFLPLPPPPLPGQSKWTFCLGSELVLLHPLGTVLKPPLLRFSWLLLRGLFTSADPPIAL